MEHIAPFMSEVCYYIITLSKSRNLHKYPLVKEGEKIKYVFLKTPNKLGRHGGEG